MDKFKDIFLGLVRHVATFGAGYLVSSGIIDASQTETVIGAVLAIVGVAWSAWTKKAAPSA